MLLFPYFPTQMNKEVAYFGLHIATRLITSKNGELLYDALFSQCLLQRTCIMPTSSAKKYFKEAEALRERGLYRKSY